MVYVFRVKMPTVDSKKGGQPTRKFSSKAPYNSPVKAMTSTIKKDQSNLKSS